MALFIGVIEEAGVNRLYISSVSVEDEKFDTEHVMADCSDRGKRDFATAKIDLRILRNKLTNGGVPHANVVIETEGAG